MTHLPFFFLVKNSVLKPMLSTNWWRWPGTIFVKLSTSYPLIDSPVTKWNIMMQKPCKSKMVEGVTGICWLCTHVLCFLLISGTHNQKYSQISLFDIPLRLFGSSAWQFPNINQLADIYFHDYALANLMVFVSCQKWSDRGNAGWLINSFFGGWA